MLSKLEFFGASDKVPESPTQRQALQHALSRHFRSAGFEASITPAVGGTLGVCFHADIAGTRRFLKTHLPGEPGRATLAKEADILRRLYGDAIVLDCIDITPEGGTPQLCLLMTELSLLPKPMTADEAAAMLHRHTARLAGYRPDDLSPQWNFARYLALGFRAIADLASQRLIETRTAAELERRVESLSAALTTLPQTLCHGDFGPRNIMSDGAHPVTIDWEDAFWGVDGYDYLYWLTFMENRSFLRTAAFGRTGLDPDIERSILALILVLKSYLSVLSGTHVQNKVPIEVRIAEVLKLPQIG